MLPSRRCQSHNRPSQVQHVAGSRPLHALRSMVPKPSSVQCAASKQPELSPQEQQLLQRVMNYQHTVDLPEGQLVISPLRERWLQQTGDLLADTFVDAKGIQPYRRYVRRNIGKYLDQHINMPPAAVLVTAVLRTEVAGSAATDLGVHEVQPSTPNNTAQTSSNSDVCDGSEGTSSSSSSSTQTAAEEPQSYDHPLTRVLLSCFGWLVKPNTPPAQAKASSTSSSDSAAAAKLLPSANRGSTASTSSTSSDGSPADAYAVVDTAAASSSSSTSRDPPAASSSSSSGGQGPPNMAELVGSALQRLSDSVVLPQLPLQHKASQTHVVETLVGIAEVSFQERTRSQALTLNPPQKCGYLCNMAVSKQWRRRGIAGTLLTAIEDMCLLAGESDLYLHLRFKDAATAGSLYRKHGFAQAKKDCWLLLLLGQEPRFLMLKTLAADRTLSGQVQLPGFKQGVTAAELKQQDQQQQEQQQQEQQQEGGDAQQQPSVVPAASTAA